MKSIISLWEMTKWSLGNSLAPLRSHQISHLADLCFLKSEYLDSYNMLLLTCGYIVCSFEEGEKQNGVYHMQQPCFPLPCVRVVVIS